MTESEMDSRKQEKYQECAFGDLKIIFGTDSQRQEKLYQEWISGQREKRQETLHQEDQKTSAAKRKRGLAFQQQSPLLERELKRVIMGWGGGRGRGKGWGWGGGAMWSG